MAEVSYRQRVGGRSLREVVASDVIVPGISLSVIIPFPAFVLVGIAYALPLALLGKWSQAHGIIDWAARATVAQTLLIHGSFVALSMLLWSISGVFRGPVGEYASDGLIMAAALVAVFAALDAVWRRLAALFS